MYFFLSVIYSLNFKIVMLMIITMAEFILLRGANSDTKAINCPLNGEDVFLSKRTGSGKSMMHHAIIVVGSLRKKMVTLGCITSNFNYERTDRFNMLGRIAFSCGCVWERH